MYNSTESALDWLHSYPELLAQADNFQEYCTLIKRDTDTPESLINYYASLRWLPPQFGYAKRFPHNPLLKTLEFPSVDNLDQLFEFYTWCPYDQRTKPSEYGYLFIGTLGTKTVLNKNKNTMSLQRGALYGKPNELLTGWIEKYPFDKQGSVSMFEHESGVLITWESQSILATHWLAYLNKNALGELSQGEEEDDDNRGSGR